MKNAFALAIASLLTTVVVPLTGQAEAGQRWVAVIPPEIGVAQAGPAGLGPYRCSGGPVYNFYHDALYSQPPAVYRGYVYRPHYRYTAWRVVPRMYVCAER